MSFFGDAPAELLYAMPGIGGPVTATVSTGSAAGGPMLGGGGAGSGSLVPPAVLPYNFFSKQGKALMIEGYGVYALGGEPTVKFLIGLDTAIGTLGTTLCSCGPFTTDTTTRTTVNFNFKVICTATQVGVNGALQVWGLLNWGMLTGVTTTVTAPQNTYLLGSGTTTPVTFNTVTSIPVYVEPYAYWSATASTTTITLTQMLLWGLN